MNMKAIVRGRARGTLLLCAVLGTAACGGRVRESADDDPTAQPTSSDLDACSMDGSEPWMGVWEGPVEHEQGRFVPLRIELGAGATGPCGTVTWGVPSGPEFNPEAMGDDYTIAITARPVAGQTYAITAGAFRDATLQLSFMPVQHFDAWCRAQATFPLEGGDGYSCLPQVGGGECMTQEDCVWNLLSGGTISASLPKVDLCTVAQACLCDAVSCVANPDGRSVSFELSIAGEAASGVYRESDAWESELVLARRR